MAIKGFSKVNDYITMLGTGNALATRCYNTCFTLHGENGVLLVDAGGGNGILTQLEKAGIRCEDISDLFVTHAHTDHLLGCIWIMRMALQFRYPLCVWSHKKVLNLLTDICRQILPQKEADGIGDLVTMHCLEDGDKFEAGGFPLQCFDIHSTKERQFGFTAHLSDGGRLCCLGDEPFSPQCRQYAEGADWLMSEAFCLYEDRDRFQPYEKHHSTVLDAARLAEELGVKNLILYHTEDRTLDTRKQSYKAEAETAFSGHVFVPDDLEKVSLQAWHEILHQTDMKLKIIEEAFSVCKVKDYFGIDLQAAFVFVGSTDEEKSLVCPTKLVPANTTERDDGWRAFRIEGVLDFSLIGILAKISACLAENDIGIFAISTFNTDYIMTKAENFEKAVKTLEAQGYKIC